MDSFFFSKSFSKKRENSIDIKVSKESNHILLSTLSLAKRNAKKRVRTRTRYIPLHGTGFGVAKEPKRVSKN